MYINLKADILVLVNILSWTTAYNKCSIVMSLMDLLFPTVFNHNRLIELNCLCILRDKCVIYVTSLAKTSYYVNVATEKYFVDIKTFIDTDSKHNLIYMKCHIGILKISGVTQITVTLITFSTLASIQQYLFRLV